MVGRVVPSLVQIGISKLDCSGLRSLFWKSLVVQIVLSVVGVRTSKGVYAGQFKAG